MQLGKVCFSAIVATGCVLSMMPAPPATAAYGQETCGRAVRNRGRMLFASRRIPIYRRGRLVLYRYNYQIRNRRGRVRNLACFWNIRNQTAEVIRL
jgi:hypothetical protein